MVKVHDVWVRNKLAVRGAVDGSVLLNQTAGGKMVSIGLGGLLLVSTQR